jgi:hypothetical protein
MFKQVVKDEIKKEQEKITSLIAAKVKLPNMSLALEIELINKMYDTFEEVVGEVLDTL